MSQPSRCRGTGSAGRTTVGLVLAGQHFDRCRADFGDPGERVPDVLRRTGDDQFHSSPVSRAM
jgi:hypothetical protein